MTSRKIYALALISLVSTLVFSLFTGISVNATGINDQISRQSLYESTEKLEKTYVIKNIMPEKNFEPYKLIDISNNDIIINLNNKHDTLVRYANIAGIEKIREKQLFTLNKGVKSVLDADNVKSTSVLLACNEKVGLADTKEELKTATAKKETATTKKETATTKKETAKSDKDTKANKKANNAGNEDIDTNTDLAEDGVITKDEKQKLAKKKITEAQKEYEKKQDEIDDLESDKKNKQDQLKELKSEVAENYEAIKQLKNDIKTLESKIESTKKDLTAAQKAADKADKLRDDRYKIVCARIRYIYEHGKPNAFDVLIKSKSYAEWLNNSYYLKKFEEYDNKILKEYMQAAKDAERKEQSLQILKDNLNKQLSNEKDAQSELEDAQKELNKQLKELNISINELEGQIKDAKEEALYLINKAVAVDMYTNIDFDSDIDKDSLIHDSNGVTGLDLVDWASQFIGNKYVYGGTDLYHGIDCSAFVRAIYAHFGYSLPRTAEEQRNYGVYITSLADAQPGDLFCYPGHIAMYCGNGILIHASNHIDGIKYSNANYRTPLCIKRIISTKDQKAGTIDNQAFDQSTFEKIADGDGDETITQSDDGTGVIAEDPVDTGEGTTENTDTTEGNTGTTEGNTDTTEGTTQPSIGTADQQVDESNTETEQSENQVEIENNTEVNVTQ